MAKSESGEKTEKPTPKRIHDARKKGDIAKSKDIGPAVGVIIWTFIIFYACGAIGYIILDYANIILRYSIDNSFEKILSKAAIEGVLAFSKASIMCLIPAIVGGILAEYAQVGNILTTEKLKFKFDNLNLGDGFKRMFNMDSLIELLKALLKSVILISIAAYFVSEALRNARVLVIPASWGADGGSGAQVAALILASVRDDTVRLLGATGGVFAFVAMADWFYSRHRFMKKMRMSKQDIKREHKDGEGDPQLKSQRRALHQEWASQSNIAAAGDAHALLVNPTHLAIALSYDGATVPIPVISGKGEGAVAAAMRAAAEQADVPIIRHVATARRLWSRGEIGEMVPEDMFDAIAEIILWAERARRGEEAMFQERE